MKATQIILKNWVITFATICTVMASSVTFAALIVPPGLNPGDQYRIVFVTSSTRDGTSSNIADYDAFVTAEANAAGSLLLPLSTTWQVIGSTLSTDAYTHIGGNFTIPVYLLDGQLIANNAVDLWDGSLNAPLYLDQFGVYQSRFINSGTTTAGGQSSAPLGGGLGSAADALTGGLAGNTNWAWITGSYEGYTASRSYYGISATLTVPNPVPVPAAAWLFGSGLLGLVGIAKRKRVV